VTTFDIEVLNPWTASNFSALATRSFCNLLDSLGPGGSVVGVGATTEGRPVGVALAEATDEGFVLRWIVVLPAHRRRGVARAVLGSLAAQIRQRGAPVIDAAYTPSWPDAPWIGRMFEGAGWPAGTRAISVTCSGTVLRERWIRQSRLPAGLGVFAWVGSGAESSLRDQLWVPPNLAPWKYQRLDPLTSIGLSRHRTTVGWLLTSRIGPDTIRYRSLFVRPDQRRLGGARLLLAEGISRQAAAFGAGSLGVFTVATENQQMMRLVGRHLRAHLVSETELVVVSKALAPYCPSASDCLAPETLEQHTCI